MYTKQKIPDWKLHRYLLGELPSHELDAINELARNCDDLRAQINLLQDEHAEVKRDYPAAWIARKGQLIADSKHQSTYKTHPKKFAHISFARIAFATLAFAVVISSVPIYMSLINNPHGSAEPALAYDVRVKGEETNAPLLQVWRKTESLPERLEHNATARAGDIVQLWYVVPSPCYGAIVSVDGRGVLTAHLSGRDGGAALLTPGRPVSLTSSYQLDDAPKYEAFYLITSPQRFSLDSVKASIMNADHPIVSEDDLRLRDKNVTAFVLQKISGAERGI